MTARGIRNRNPGNLDFNSRAFARDPWVGELGLEDHPSARFTTFDTARHGIRALCKILLTYRRHRRAADGSVIDTVQENLVRWAPPGENDTDAYAAQVRLAMGVEPGQEIDVEDPTTLMRLAAAIIRHENGSQPYGQDTLRAGAVMALDRPVIGLEVVPPPKPLVFDVWEPVRGKAQLTWLPDDEFNALVRQHGKDPQTTDGLAMWKGWFGDRIYVRARSLTGVVLHEARHIETQSNFHK